MSSRTHDKECFFKYASFKTAMRVIESKTFRWSSPIKFNDPFDHQVGFKINDRVAFASAFAESRERMIFSDSAPEGEPDSLSIQLLLHLRKIRDRVPRTELVRISLEGAQDIDALLETHIEKLTAQAHSLLGHSRLFCVSETHDNVVMWSHYADEHKGIVFKLRCIDAIDNHLLAARKVAYSRDFLPFPAEAYARHLAGEKAFIFDSLFWSMAFTKHEDWSYEKEWRVHEALMPHEPFGDGYSFHREDQRVFDAIFLGCRMEHTEVDTVVSAVQQHLPNMKIFRGKQSRSNFAIEFSEV